MKNRVVFRKIPVCMILCLTLISSNVYGASMEGLAEGFCLASVVSGINGVKLKVSSIFNEVPAEADLSVDTIWQLPELPTGCETTALTMVLNYHGFSVDKTTIADDYLVRATEDYPVGFSGDPYSYDGAGIWPPGLAKTARKYLADQNTTLWAHDVSGASLEDLYGYVAAGYPVLLWVTVDYSDPSFTDYAYEYKGKTYDWFSNEHCVVLSGYSKTNNTVTLQDPEQGEIQQDADLIAGIMDQIGDLAVCIY